MDLERFLNRMDSGIQTHWDKKLRRAVYPQIARALGGTEAASIGANAAVQKSLLGAQGMMQTQSLQNEGTKDVAGIKEKGALARRKLIETGVLSLQGMKGRQKTQLAEQKANLEDWFDDKKSDREGKALRAIKDLGLGGTGGGGNRSNMEDILDESLGPLSGRLDRLERKKKKDNDTLPSYQLPY